MKKIILTAFILLLFSVSIFAQMIISSVSFNGAGTTSFSKRNDLKVKSLNGYGAEADLRFKLFDKFNLVITGGYQELTIKQDEFALFAEWNWKAWQRYFGDINDKNFATSTQWVQSLLKDPDYAASFDPVQKMDYIPLLASVNYPFNFSKLEITPSAGAGMIFYSRRLYVQENWQRRYPKMDDYVYRYSYRNLAESKTGNPVAATIGADASYSLSSIIQLKAAVKYLYVFDTGSRFGYNDFPADDLFTARLGITFLY